MLLKPTPLLWNAIENTRGIRFAYDGKDRVVEPHDHGATSIRFSPAKRPAVDTSNGTCCSSDSNQPAITCMLVSS